MGIFLVVLLQFETADGRVCRATCPTLARCIFVVLTFSLVVLRHCYECVPWRSSLFAIFMIFFITVTSEHCLFTVTEVKVDLFSN